MGLYLLGKEGGREEWREVSNEEARVAASPSSIVLCYKPVNRWRTGDGVKRVDRKGRDGGRDRTAGFRILKKEGFLV